MLNTSTGAGVRGWLRRLGLRKAVRKRDVSGEARDAGGRWTTVGQLPSLPEMDPQEDTQARVHNSVQVLARTGQSTLERIVQHSRLSPREAMTALDALVREGKLLRDGRIYRMGTLRPTGPAPELVLARPEPQLGFDFGKSHVRGYWRTLKSGKRVWVGPHDDSRTHHEEPPAPAGPAAAPGAAPAAAPAAGDVPGALSPEEDYRRNGTRARAFLAWFGDWTRGEARASKVRKPNGEPRETFPVEPSPSRVRGKDGRPVTVYHGSSRPAFNHFDPAKADRGALMGPGFYFTEDRETAESYTRKEADTATLKMPKLQAERRVKQRVAESSLSPDDKRRVSRMAEDLGTGYVDRHAFEHYGIDVSDIYASADSPGHVLEVYLAIRNPFDADRGRIPLDAVPAQYRRKVERSAGKSAGYSFEQLSDALSPGIANDIVRSLGHDGITHLGGTIMGNGTEHRVWIAFHPTQVKAVANRGTFHPEDAHMFKAQATDRPAPRC